MPTSTEKASDKTVGVHQCVQSTRDAIAKIVQELENDLGKRYFFRNTEISLQGILSNACELWTKQRVKRAVQKVLGSNLRLNLTTFAPHEITADFATFEAILLWIKSICGEWALRLASYQEDINLDRPEMGWTPVKKVNNAQDAMAWLIQLHAKLWAGYAIHRLWPEGIDWDWKCDVVRKISEEELQQIVKLVASYSFLITTEQAGSTRPGFCIYDKDGSRMLIKFDTYHADDNGLRCDDFIRSVHDRFKDLIFDPQNIEGLETHSISLPEKLDKYTY